MSSLTLVRFSPSNRPLHHRSISRGRKAVQASAQDLGGVARVEFYLDNVLRAVSTTSPYVWNFDTGTASNGVHTLTVKAYDLAGNIGQASLSISTSNATALPRPVIPQHYSHIRIAQFSERAGGECFRNNIRIAVRSRNKPKR